MPLAKARAAHPCPALDVRCAGARLASALAGALLGCGQSAGSTREAPPDSAGYEGVNFYEANGNEPPSIDSAPIAGVPSYEFVTGEALPACNAGVGQRPTAEPSDAVRACPPVVRESISDFSFTGDPNSVTFANDAALPGGTFHYPSAPGTLVSDVTGDDWHIYGTVRQISGFGIYLNGCGQIDAGAYRGVAFRLRGEIGEGGALVFFVGTAANQVASSWVNANKPSSDDPDEPDNLGRCIPLGGRYDGTCREARRVLNVTPDAERALILWRDLSEGCPEASVNSTEITSIAWYFPQPISGSYTVDIHIDDLRFSDEGPL